MKSERKIFHDFYLQLVTIDNIFQAYYEFRKGKRNKRDILEFEVNLEENLFDLYYDLISGKYTHDLYQHFSVCDPKPRKISKAGARDRVVHHLVSQKLKEIFEPTFIYDSYSCRKDKGTHGAVKRLEKFISLEVSIKTASTIIKCDIKRFFASIDHQIIIGILSKKINDERFIGLLKKIIFSFQIGIPLGNLTSQYFANIYLNELDQFVKHELKIKYYIRYCDDFLIIADSVDYMQIMWIINQIRLFLKIKLNLDLHPNKISIRKPSQGIDFLGYVVFPKYTAIRNKAKRRMMKSIGKKEYDFLETVISYFGLLKWCKSYKIKKEICKLICNKNQKKLSLILPTNLFWK